MKMNNYTSVKNREQRLYELGGKKFSSGISISMLQFVVPVSVGIIIIGAIIAKFMGIAFFNPFNPNFKVGYTLFWLALSIGTALALYNIPVTGYRLYEYLLAYLRPKKVYTSDFRLTQKKFFVYKIKAFVKSILQGGSCNEKWNYAKCYHGT